MATIPIIVEINEETIVVEVTEQNVTIDVPALIGVEVGQDFTPFTQQNSNWDSTSGVTEILNKPILGTASALDVPVSGNASPTQVVLGSDSRLSGGGGGIVDSVTATSPLLSSGGANPDISIPPATSLVNGYATSTQIAKLDSIQSGAEVNVNADWNSISGDSEILNKPTIPTQYTDELAQDAVGSILTNTSNVQFVYDDVTPKITASVDLSGKQDVLGFTPVPNTRTVNGHVLNADVTVSKSDVGLSNVDNTSDANKPISSATQTALDSKVDENLPIIGATKTKIAYDSKGLVTSGTDATTSDIADSLNKRYVTDANLTTIGNQSGTNTGDNSTNSLYSGLATSKQDTLVSGTNIKTINSTPLLGGGDIVVLTSLSGAVLTDQTTPQIIGTTGSRLTKVWATDISSTNPIDGSVTGNSATVTTNANLSGAVTSVGNSTSLGSFTTSQLNTALSDNDIATGGGTASGTNTSDVTLGTANGLSLLSQQLSLGIASSGVTGALSGTDWNTFNNKISVVTIDGSLTGDGSTGNPLSASSGATTVTAGATTTLTVSSATIQEFTGTTTQIVVLPVVTTLRLGHQFTIANHSTGSITLNSSGGNLVGTITPGNTLAVRCILLTGTSEVSWDSDYLVQPSEYINLSAIGNLTSSANKGIQFTGSGTASTFDLTTAGKALLDDADVSAQRTTLSVPALVTTSVADNFVSFSNTIGAQKDSGKGLSHLVYTLQWSQAAGWSPVDGTTYYLGGKLIQDGNPARAGLYFPIGGTIIVADFCSYVGTTLATTETSSAWIRINNTTDTLISNAIQQDQIFERFVNSTLSIAVNAGDYVEIKWTTPTWTTNPTNTRQYGIIMIRV